MFRQSVASMISADGEVEVETQITDPKAIELAKETQPDVVIMQVEQPPDSAATEIRGILEASPESKIVILTAYQAPSMVKKMLGLAPAPTSTRALR